MMNINWIYWGGHPAARAENKHVRTIFETSIGDPWADKTRPVCDKCYALAEQHGIKWGGVIPLRTIKNILEQRNNFEQEADEKYQQIVAEKNKLHEQKIQLENELKIQIELTKQHEKEHDKIVAERNKLYEQKNRK
jgi:hypothetical protein